MATNAQLIYHLPVKLIWRNNNTKMCSEFFPFGLVPYVLLIWHSPNCPNDNGQLCSRKETPHSRTSPSGSRKDQPPCSKKPSGSSTMVFMILVQLRDCTPSVYFRSQELREITLQVKINPLYYLSFQCQMHN